jgi:hypothetical protein
LAEQQKKQQLHLTKLKECSVLRAPLDLCFAIIEDGKTMDVELAKWTIGAALRKRKAVRPPTDMDWKHAEGKIAREEYDPENNTEVSCSWRCMCALDTDEDCCRRKVAIVRALSILRLMQISFSTAILHQETQWWDEVLRREQNPKWQDDAVSQRVELYYPWFRKVARGEIEEFRSVGF